MACAQLMKILYDISDILLATIHICQSCYGHSTQNITSSISQFHLQFSKNLEICYAKYCAIEHTRSLIAYWIFVWHMNLTFLHSCLSSFGTLHKEWINRRRKKNTQFYHTSTRFSTFGSHIILQSFLVCKKKYLGIDSIE